MTDQESTGEEITLKMVFEHMQHGFGLLRKEMGSMKSETGSLRSDIQRLEKKTDAGFTDLRHRWRWFDSLDLQQRVSDLEDKVFAGIDPRK